MRNRMLLIKVSPYDNETLSSFIFRTAKENFMHNLNWIIDNINTNLQEAIFDNIMDWIEKPITTELANLLGLTEDEISRMTFPYHISRLGLTMTDLYKCPWFIYRTIRCCPNCLKEKLYVRQDWCLSQSICCTVHKKYLVDRCSCGRELTTKMAISGHCLCGQPLHLIQSKDVKTNTSYDFQKFLNHFFYESDYLNCNSWISTSTTFFKAVEFFASWVPVITNKEYISSIDELYYDGTAHARTRLKKSKSVNQSIVLYCMAYKLLREWPVSYHTMLEQAGTQDEGKLEMFFKRAITKLVNTPLNAISSEFTKFLQTNKLKIDSNECLLRSDEAKSLASRYKDTAINEEILNNYQCYLHNLKITLYDNKQLEEWLNILDTLIKKEELREIWKTSSKATFTILNSGILKEVYRFQQGSVIAWGVSKRSLNQLIQELNKGSTNEIPDKISLNEAFHWIGPELAHYIVKGMLQGEINFCVNEITFGESFVSRSHCYLYLENVLLDVANKDGKISLRSLVFILGVKKSDILFWINNGRLETVDGFEDVTYSSFNSFHQTYLTSYQLAFKKNLTVKQILKLNQLKKISAVFGPHTGDGKRLVFLRSDFPTI